MNSILVALEKVRKAAIIFVMSVRPPARVEKLDSRWTDFHEILHLTIFFESQSR